MINQNFIVSGMMGDFLHCMYVVKHICTRDNTMANIYLVDGHHGDVWNFGKDTAHNDLLKLMGQQSYVAGFYNIADIPDNYINLNAWRLSVATTFHETGEYNKCWSDVLSEFFKFAPAFPKWINVDEGDVNTTNKILIHRSIHRHGGLPWQKIVDQFDELLFVTSNPSEFDHFPVKSSKVKLYQVANIYDMASAMKDCKYFIGNQSALFALASALDIPRLVELEQGVWKFYGDETKYSTNMSWYLNDITKNIQTDIIKL